MHDFVVVWSERALLLRGLGNTILLSLAATVAAFALGACAIPTISSTRSDIPISHSDPSRAARARHR